jgi:hypothetical protein
MLTYEIKRFVFINLGFKKYNVILTCFSYFNLFYFTYLYCILIFLKFHERPKINNTIIYFLSQCVFLFFLSLNIVIM